MFQKSLEELSSRLAGAEAIQSGWQPVAPAPTSNGTATTNGDLHHHPPVQGPNAEQLEQLSKYGERLAPIQRLLEEANDQASAFASSSVIVSHALLAKLEDLNARFVYSFKCEISVLGA